MTIHLTDEEKALANGAEGEAAKFGMEIILRAAEAAGAKRLQAVTSAHIVDTLLYGSGQTGPDFAAKLAQLGARVRVPTSINTGSVDLVHPDLNRPDGPDFVTARDVMRIYRDMGCTPIYTCAPFQEPQNQLRFGEHVAWGESNAVSYANAVFGARTNRYGNFISVAAALTGRVPYTGLHLDENRRGQVVVRLDDVPESVMHSGLFYHVLGYLVGDIAGERIPVVEGLPPNIPTHHIKSFGAAAASSGAVAMYHIVGVTPEAATLSDALHGGSPEETVRVGLAELNAVRARLTGHHAGAALSAVCLGAPHLSIEEVEHVHRLLAANSGQPKVPIYLTVSRRTAEIVRDRGWQETFDAAGVVVVTDRCVYFPGILEPGSPSIMTDSAKWAHYAPACINATVTIGSLADCVASAMAGVVVTTDSWTEAV
jgi:predicted aconitase